MTTFSYFEYPENITNSLEDLKNKPASYWESKGKEKLLEFVNFTMTNVFAFQHFIKEHGSDLTEIKTLEEFKTLPWINKKNYLKKYPFKDLLPKGYESKITTFSSTSGSTGEPFYFPRGEEQDAQYQYLAEIFLNNQFDIKNKKTLAIIGFGLGIWIGGIFTYKNLNMISRKGYALSLAPTGTNKEIFLKTFKELARYYDQTILMGYPPFIKDVIDNGPLNGINWSEYSLKIMTATEGFSEKFRDYLVKKTKINNKYRDIINIYGSVELGTMAHETPITIIIRELACNNPQIFKEIFPHARLLPTLTQYHPQVVNFEEVDGEVLATGYGSSYPLVRYQFFDRGGVIPFEDMLVKLKRHGIDLYTEAKRRGVEETIFKLPFVYVYERSDFVVILRGANIYSENIKAGLQEESIEKWVTGKFTMQVAESKQMEEYLLIHVELKKGIEKIKSLISTITNAIVDSLRRDNSEYNYLYNTEGVKLTPNIILHPYEDPEYFQLNIKQKWVKK